jgi:hypothetical protein
MNTCVLGLNAVVTILALCLPVRVAATEHRPATLTTEELRQRLLEANARVRAWYVEYESAREDSTGKPAVSYMHRVVAAKAFDRFFLWNTHGAPWLDWREDPDQQRLFLASGTAITDEAFHRVFRVSPWAADATVPGSAKREFLFVALGWWPLDKRLPPMPGDLPTVLPAVARSPKYVASSRQELVQGRWCHILEYPGRDRLWLDCERNCVIVAREAFDEKGLLRQRIESSRYREVLSGIWVPFEFRNIHFDPARPNPRVENGVKTLDSVLRVIDVRLNDQVTDGVFRFEPLPGSIRIENNRIQQELPGCADYLDKVVDWSQKHFELPSSPSQHEDSGMEAVLEYTIIGAGVATVLAYLFRCRRRPKNTRRGVEPDEALPKSKETV